MKKTLKKIKPDWAEKMLRDLNEIGTHRPDINMQDAILKKLRLARQRGIREGMDLALKMNAMNAKAMAKK